MPFTSFGGFFVIGAYALPLTRVCRHPRAWCKKYTPAVKFGAVHAIPLESGLGVKILERLLVACVRRCRARQTEMERERRERNNSLAK